jgi:hypothetical protein
MNKLRTLNNHLFKYGFKGYFKSDCIGYNIHNIKSEDHRDLELADVTQWRFSFKEFKMSE